MLIQRIQQIKTDSSNSRIQQCGFPSKVMMMKSLKGNDPQSNFIKVYNNFAKSFCWQDH